MSVRGHGSWLCSRGGTAFCSFSSNYADNDPCFCTNSSKSQHNALFVVWLLGRYYLKLRHWHSWGSEAQRFASWQHPPCTARLWQRSRKNLIKCDMRTEAALFRGLIHCSLFWLPCTHGVFFSPIVDILKKHPIGVRIDLSFLYRHTPTIVFLSLTAHKPT